MSSSVYVCVHQEHLFCSSRDNGVWTVRCQCKPIQAFQDASVWTIQGYMRYRIKRQKLRKRKLNHTLLCCKTRTYGMAHKSNGEIRKLSALNWRFAINLRGESHFWRCVCVEIKKFCAWNTACIVWPVRSKMSFRTKCLYWVKMIVCSRRPWNDQNEE